MDKNTSWLSQEDIEMLDKFRVNKTKSKVHHHFNTTGKIFSFGYGPKYEKTGNHGYSIEKYVDKTSRKKITVTEKDWMFQIEKNVELEMVQGIRDISKKMSSMPSITSPEIGTLQNCLHLYHESDHIKHQLLEYGYLNCHICFNAETEIEHTECDSSYTIITLPNQPVKSSKQQNYNSGVFQFVVNKEEVDYIVNEIWCIILLLWVSTNTSATNIQKVRWPSWFCEHCHIQFKNVFWTYDGIIP